jgi:hypothetical protein
MALWPVGVADGDIRYISDMRQFPHCWKNGRIFGRYTGLLKVLVEIVYSGIKGGWNKPNSINTALMLLVNYLIHKNTDSGCSDGKKTPETRLRSWNYRRTI